MVLRRVCVVTGSRAEYGLLKNLMDQIRRSDVLQLQVVATGMHLSPEFGYTYKEILADGFVIDGKLETLMSSDTPQGVSKAIGLGCIGLVDILFSLSPDILLVLGDRFEVFPAVVAALTLGIPVGHIHGGETTEGAIDEAIRHSITKMAHFHFVAAEEYRRRVIQLGEQHEKVFVVGGMGIDRIQEMQFLDQSSLESIMGKVFGQENVLVTYHPVSLNASSARNEFRQILEALDCFPDMNVIFTLPNADAESREIIQLIQAYTEKRDNAFAFKSLGHQVYLSCARLVDIVLGNSSSGLAEIPSLGKPTVNIGSRQDGRLKALSVIDCSADTHEICQAIQKAKSLDFKKILSRVENPYGQGGASLKIVKLLETISLDNVRIKKFNDIR